MWEVYRQVHIHITNNIDQIDLAEIGNYHTMNTGNDNIPEFNLLFLLFEKEYVDHICLEVNREISKQVHHLN